MDSPITGANLLLPVVVDSDAELEQFSSHSGRITLMLLSVCIADQRAADVYTEITNIIMTLLCRFIIIVIVIVIMTERDYSGTVTDCRALYRQNS